MRRASDIAVVCLLGGGLFSACASDEMMLTSKIDEVVSIEVRAPDVEILGRCETPFRERFCAEEYEIVGVLDVSPQEERLITLSDTVDSEHCTNLLWLRLVRLGSVGPVSDPGTLFQLPTDAEIELGAGALHSVAFPQATVRLDEVGTLDANQSPPPDRCSDG